MRVLVTGATGLIGQALIKRLEKRGDEAIWLSRRPGILGVFWDPINNKIDIEALNKLGGIDVVIHLAGESIATDRWTKAKRELIRNSRVQGTQLLSKTLGSLKIRPRTLISASAIGFYGNRAEEELTERSESGSGFLPEVCRVWESSAQPARDAGIRVVHTRMGVVLTKSGGALPMIMRPFKYGLGGPIGSGKQYMSWISLHDVVGLIIHAIDTPEIQGPLNLTSPHPVTNYEFSQCLARTMQRSSWLPLPSGVAKIALGEMANELLLASSRVIPKIALETKYAFAHTKLEPYLWSELLTKE